MGSHGLRLTIRENVMAAVLSHMRVRTILVKIEPALVHQVPRQARHLRWDVARAPLLRLRCDRARPVRGLTQPHCIVCPLHAAHCTVPCRVARSMSHGVG